MDARDAVQAMVSRTRHLSLQYDAKTADALLAGQGEVGKEDSGKPTSLSLIYSYGDFRAASKVARSDDVAAKPIEIAREALCRQIKWWRFSRIRLAIWMPREPRH